jgi:hypothetical protein
VATAAAVLRRGELDIMVKGGERVEGKSIQWRGKVNSVERENLAGGFRFHVGWASEVKSIPT